MVFVKYSCSSPSYIFIVFLCTSFLKISYCVNVLSGACMHHGLLLSIHFHKGIANYASVILIGLIFCFYFCFLHSVDSQQASSQLWWFPKHLNKENAATACYPVPCCLMLAFCCKTAREKLWRADGLSVKQKKEKRKNTCTAGRAKRRGYSGKTLAAWGGTHWETSNSIQGGA